MIPLVAAIAASPSPSPSPIPQIAHVVTSDRGQESAARAARTTYVVTAQQIARDGDRTIADALEKVPGVNVVRYGAFGSLTAVGIRGSSSQQVLVLMDGLPVAGVQIDDVNLEQYSVTGVNRIEVVEGGGSTLYGSGSVGGVINIITATPSTHAAALASTGSFGESSYALTTPYLSWMRTYAANDYSVVNAPNRQNAQAGLTSLAGRYGKAVGAFNLTILGSINTAQAGAPGQLGSFSPTNEGTNVARNLQLDAEHSGARSTAELQLGVSSATLTDTCNTPVDSNCPNSFFPTPSPSMTSNPPYAQVLYDQRWMASLRNNVGDDHERIVYGVDVARGVARVDPGTGGGSPTAADNAPIFYDYAQTAAYGQAQWFWQRGSEIYAGLRAEHDGGVGGAYSPSLGGIFVFSKALQLRVNAGTAFRAPTAEELYYPGFSNPHLQPERERTGDATFVAPTSWGEARFGWFSLSGSNLIVSPPPLYVPENVGRASIQGLLLSLQARTLYHCVANLDVTNVYRAQDLASGLRIPGRAPVFAVGLGLRYEAPVNRRFDGFTIGVRAQGAQESPDPFLAQRYAIYQPAAFTDLQAYVGYRITPLLVIGVRGENLGNDRYALYAGYPMPGRSVSIELRSR
ncbi:MAG: TonB-dependent receptor [Candidatus Eremiobacteraeota bacterium]|nr:TonB-dependent receptor [Candidatus Eremiobacteraeota bacterium]MBV9056144.1 TonB-dependent receptor [Candidatus Eremiobacteraeota bacterium]MBV9700530.1 TonB-dependent receptor [Candidatus Eremiobacteraeota bacterium]